MTARTVIIKNVPTDGHCGTNTLVDILNDKNIRVDFNGLQKLLGIDSAERGVWLEASDLGTVASYYGRNLIIISQGNDMIMDPTAFIAFVKPNRENLYVLFSKCH